MIIHKTFLSLWFNFPLPNISSKDIKYICYIIFDPLISARPVYVMVYIQTPVDLNHHGHHSLIFLVKCRRNNATCKGAIYRHRISVAFKVPVHQSLYFFRSMVWIGTDADVSTPLTRHPLHTCQSTGMPDRIRCIQIL